MDLEQLRLADQALQDLLETRKDEDVSLSGRNYLDQETQSRIDQFLINTNNRWIADVLPQLPNGEHTLDHLLERFEEMQRRVKKKASVESVPTSVQNTIYQLLAVRYGVLLTLFVQQNGKNNRCLVSCLLYNPNFFGEIDEEEEFVWCKDELGLIKYAASNNSSDPREFLRGMKKTMDEIPEEEEFVWCKDEPGLIKRAAKHNPTDPREFLRGVKKVMDEIPEEEEFVWCKDELGLIKRAAKGNPDDPREFLRGVKKVMDEIPEEEEFVWCKDELGLIKYAASNNSSDPREFLRGMKKTMDEIPTEVEFVWCKDELGLIKRAAIRRPDDPRSWLREQVPERSKIATT
jgi:predicted 3-demethylubiquinone-9 3-methyltransferase (glyoxalase superfamily)